MLCIALTTHQPTSPSPRTHSPNLQLLLVEKLFAVIYATVGVFGDQKSDNFRSNKGSCFDWSF